MSTKKNSNIFGKFYFLPSEKFRFSTPLVAFLVFVVVFLRVETVKAEPIDEQVVSEIEYFAIKAFGEEGYKQRFDRFYARRPSRLEWAKYFNEIAWKIEAKKIYLSSDEEKRFDRIVRYFDREYLLINAASMLDSVPRLSLGAEFSLNSEYGWGEDMAASVLSLYQQLRLTIEARKKNLFGRLSLRNFGFWGVNDYSSGSVGIDFKTSDPPSIEEVWVEAGQNARITVGRRYFKYGVWGLAVNRIYLPIDMLEVSYRSGDKNFFVTRLAACSKYENADYFISELGFNGEDFGLGAAGALSEVSEKVMSDAGVDENERAASLWSWVKPFEGFVFKTEGGIYKRKPDDGEVFPFVVETEVIPTTEVEFFLRYGRIPAMRFPFYPPARAPLDYYPKEYIGARFSPKTEGFNSIIALKYASPFVVELEYTSLNGIDENVRYNKGTARGILLGSSLSEKGIFDRVVAEISTTLLDTTEKDSAEHRFVAQCAFKF